MQPFAVPRAALWGAALLATLSAPPAGAAGRGATPPLSARYPPGMAVQLHRRLVAVTIQGFAFHPSRLVVSPGTTIVWTNRDSDPHTVDSTVGLWTSAALDTDGRFKRLFPKPGTFRYYCSVHPFMHGVIVVARG